MLKFTSSGDLARLPKTDPAQPVISLMIDNLFTETSNTDPVTIALMQPHDADPPLADLCNAEDVTLEGVIEQAGMFLVVLQTDYGYGLVLVIPDAEWLTGGLRNSIEDNLYS